MRPSSERIKKIFVYFPHLCHEILITLSLEFREQIWNTLYVPMTPVLLRMQSTELWPNTHSSPPTAWNADTERGRWLVPLRLTAASRWGSPVAGDREPGRDGGGTAARQHQEPAHPQEDWYQARWEWGRELTRRKLQCVCGDRNCAVNHQECMIRWILSCNILFLLYLCSTVTCLMKLISFLTW